ncbi:MAG: hypothetical protein WCM93_14450 [Bacteroidota bacterium]
MRTKTEKWLEYFNTLDIKELRWRQNLIIKQQKLAFEQNNKEGLLTLQMLEKIIAEAIDKKEFGE